MQEQLIQLTRKKQLSEFLFHRSAETLREETQQVAYV